MPDVLVGNISASSSLWWTRKHNLLSFFLSHHRYYSTRSGSLLKERFFSHLYYQNTPIHPIHMFIAFEHLFTFFLSILILPFSYILASFSFFFSLSSRSHMLLVPIKFCLSDLLCTITIKTHQLHDVVEE
jgi:hypothetical protein